MEPVTVCIVIVFALPALVGVLAQLAAGSVPHPLTAVTAGTLVIWAVMEVCLVPLIKIGASFRGSILVVWTAAALVTVLLALAAGHRFLDDRKKKRRAMRGKNKPDASSQSTVVAEPLTAKASSEVNGATMMRAAASSETPAAAMKTVVQPAPQADGSVTPAAGPQETDAPQKVQRRSLSDRVYDLIFLIPLVLVLIMVLRGTALYTHADNDDTRFVVNAVDMVRTDTLLRTNPATGNPIQEPFGELKKDAIAPWAFYIAMLSEMTGVKAAAIAHTYLPVMIMLIITCALFALGRTLFDKERWKIYVFITICWLVNLFGYYSVYSAEAFVMGRLWQGKAVLAGFGIPVLLELLFRIYREPALHIHYIRLAVAVTGLALLSSQSIVLTSVAAAFFALVYAIALRKPSILFKMGAACVPNLILLAVYALT